MKTGYRYDAVSHFHQPEKTYRFSSDSLALANFVDLGGVKTAADLGAGCGIVGLAALENRLRSLQQPPAPDDRGQGKEKMSWPLNPQSSLRDLKLSPSRRLSGRGRPGIAEAAAEHCPDRGLDGQYPASGDDAPRLPEVLYFVEREKTFLDSLEKNLALYQPRVGSLLRIVKRDWRELTADDFGGPLDFIMVNPPYFPAGSGRPSPEPSREAARREIYGGLPDLCAALSRLLRAQGRAALILPRSRRQELESAAGRWGLLPETVRPAFDKPDSPILGLFRNNPGR